MNIVINMSSRLLRIMLPAIMLLMVPVMAAADIVLPQPLSAADIDRYQQIFVLQQDKKWKQADKIIKTLDNDLLMGRVLSQLFAPDWLAINIYRIKKMDDEYHDHPSATRIYRLAKNGGRQIISIRKRRKKDILTDMVAPMQMVVMFLSMSFVNRSSPSKTRAIARDVRRKIRSGYPTGGVKPLLIKIITVI